MTPTMNEEQEVLGTLMANTFYYRILIGLRPHHFVDPMHAVIYDDIVRRIEVGEPVDAVVLRDVYRARGMAHWFGPPDAPCAYLALLLSCFEKHRATTSPRDRMRACKYAIIAAWRERMEVSARFWIELSQGARGDAT